MLTGRSKPLRLPKATVGGRIIVPCSRCGRDRQVQPARMNPDGLCADCRASDPKVWRQKSA